VNSNPARIFVIGLVSMFILIGIASVIGAIMNPHYMINYTGGWVGIAWGVVGTLIGLFFLFIFILIIVWFARSIGWMSRSYRYSSRNGWTWWDHDDALEILRERYAKGEKPRSSTIR
jgi:uncharacterized membrane protein